MREMLLRYILKLAYFEILFDLKYSSTLFLSVLTKRDFDLSNITG
jgi:hypothetical protein